MGAARKKQVLWHGWCSGSDFMNLSEVKKQEKCRTELVYPCSTSFQSFGHHQSFGRFTSGNGYLSYK